MSKSCFDCKDNTECERRTQRKRGGRGIWVTVGKERDWKGDDDLFNLKHWLFLFRFFRGMEKSFRFLSRHKKTAIISSGQNGESERERKSRRKTEKGERPQQITLKNGRIRSNTICIRITISFFIAETLIIQWDPGYAIVSLTGFIPKIGTITIQNLECFIIELYFQDQQIGGSCCVYAKSKEQRVESKEERAEERMSTRGILSKSNWLTFDGLFTQLMDGNLCSRYKIERLGKVHSLKIKSKRDFG